MYIEFILLLSSLVGGISSTLNVLRTDKSMINKSMPIKPHRLAVLLLLDKFNTPGKFLPFPVANVAFDPSKMMGFDDPTNKQCMLTAAKFVLDRINSRDDILPDYELEFYYNDGPSISAIYAVQLLLEFFSISERGLGNLLNSRFVVGPSVVCTGQLHASVRDTMTKFKKFGGFFILSPMYCNDESAVKSSPVYGVRFFPALLALMNFAKTVGWKQIGLISGISLEASSPMAFAVTVNGIAAENGLNVIHFGFDDDYYKMFKEIKQNTRVRIILMMSWSPSPYYCIYLWCAAHRAGIRAPKYVLLLPNNYCASYIAKPIDLPPGFTLQSGRTFESCLSAIQMEQAKMTIFSYNAEGLFSDEPLLKTFSEVVFADQLDELVIPNQDIAIAQNSSGCNEPLQRWDNVVEMLQLAAFRVDIAEKRLRLRFNASLSEIAARKQDNTLAQIHFDIADEMYYRSSLKKEPEAIVFQVDKGKYRYLHRTRFEQSTPYNVNYFFPTFNVTTLNKVEWQTETGSPPPDLSHVIRIRGDVDPDAAVALTIAAIIQVLILLLIAGLALKTLTRANTRKQKRLPYFAYGSNFLILFGCVLISISVVILMQGSLHFLKPMCPWRPLFIVSSLTLINGMLFSKTQALPTFTSLHLYVSSTARMKREFQVKDFERKRKWDLEQVQLNVKKGFGALLALAVLAQLTWYLSDPMTWAFHVEYEDDPLFDFQLDSYYDIKLEYCTSNYQMHFIWGFVMFHAFMLVIGSFISANLKRSAKYLRKRFSNEVQLTRLAIVNATTIFLFFVLLLIVVRGRPAHFAHLQVTLISIGLLLLSLSTSLIIFYPCWRPSNWTIWNKSEISPVISVRITLPFTTAANEPQDKLSSQK